MEIKRLPQGLSRSSSGEKHVFANYIDCHILGCEFNKYYNYCFSSMGFWGFGVIGKRIFLKIDDREFLLNFNNNIYSNHTKNEIIESAENIYLKVSSESL